MSTEFQSEAAFSKDLSLKFFSIAGAGSRIFRNNVGLGWSGSIKHKVMTPMKVILNRGDVVLSNARPVRFGLCEGSSDKIGWTQITITPEMVGKKIAVFTAIEEKSKKGKASQVQKNFLGVVSNCGGIAAIAKSLDDLKSAIDSYRPS